MDKQVVISIKAIIFTLFMLLGGYIIYRLGSVFGILLISLLIVFSVEPMVKKFMGVGIFGKKLSRGFSVVISYVILVFVISIVLTLILPTFIIETQRLLTLLSSIFGSLNISSPIDFSSQSIINQLTSISTSFLTALYGSFRFIATLFTVLILSIYMSSDWENIKSYVAAMFPDRIEEEILSTINEIEVSLGHWVKGQLVLMTVIGLFSTIGLLGLNVKYALALGLFAGLLEIVPMIGPIISAIIAGVVAFVDSPIKGLGVIILFTIIQQLENNILVPKIMQKVSGFSPLIILIALLVGSEFLGILGAIVAVPITMVAGIILKRVLRFRD